MELSIGEQKKTMRQVVRERLAGMERSDYLRLNQRLLAAFFKLEAVNQAKRIMIYYSIQNEVNTASIIQRLLDSGKTVFLPVCRNDHGLSAGLFKKTDQLVEGKFQLKEPSPGECLGDPAALELVVLPGLAFDWRGRRLGRGGGYYDRFLTELNPATYKLGLAYDFQIFNELPVDVHDIPVDGVLTPSRFWDFRPRTA